MIFTILVSSFWNVSTIIGLALNTLYLDLKIVFIPIKRLIEKNGVTAPEERALPPSRQTLMKTEVMMICLHWFRENPAEKLKQFPHVQGNPTYVWRPFHLI